MATGGPVFLTKNGYGSMVECSLEDSFTKPTAHEETPKQVTNPKRRQRAASREMRRCGPSTKAQRALAEECEASAQQRKADALTRRPASIRAFSRMIERPSVAS